MHVVVVSPARPVYEGEARFIDVAGLQSRIGVYPKHADLVAALGIGPLRIGLEGGGEERYAVWGGFLKVGGDKVTVLVDRAVPADEVVPNAVKQELDGIIADLRRPDSDGEFEALLDRRAWCEARLKLAVSA